MIITIQYFASLREQVGRSSDQLETSEPLTAMQAWQQATGIPDLLDNLLIAVNQEYCSAETVLSDGDELAFFPPVTGG